jgi:repeat organellar protein
MKSEKFEELNKLYFNVESFYYNANKDNSEKTTVTTIIDKLSKVGENDTNKEEEFTSKYATLDEKAQKLINMVEEIKEEEEIIRKDTQEITFKGIKDYKSIDEVKKENNAEKINKINIKTKEEDPENGVDETSEENDDNVVEEIEETEEMKLKKELALQIEKVQELEKQNIGLNNKVKQLESEKDKILIKSNERLLEEKDRELSRLKGVYNSSIDMLDFLKDMKNFFKVNQSVKENNEKIIQELRELQKVISSKDEEIKVLKDFYSTFKSLEIEVED